MAEKRKGRITAAEHMAQLQADPEWVRRKTERDAQQQARIEQRLKEIEPEAAPVVTDMVAAGVKFYPTKLDEWESNGTITGPEPIPLRSISNLVNTLDNYRAAIPIMAKHLREAKHPVVIATLARALTVKEACRTEAFQVILDKLKRTEPCAAKRGDAYQARWALANALIVVGDENVVEEIKALIANPNFADVRERLNEAIKHCERLTK